jgi:hypothetical protein
MVKGEALLFLAGHFFFKPKIYFNSLLAATISREQCPNQASCVYRRLFLKFLYGELWNSIKLLLCHSLVRSVMLFSREHFTQEALI